MKTVRKITVVFLIAICSSITLCLKAQDPSFSQPMNNPLLLNPSMMGMNNSFRAILNYRNQWMDIDEGFNTGSFSLVLPVFLKKDMWRLEEGRNRLDFGINTTGDKAGAFTRLNASLSIGYGLYISDYSFLHSSINIGYIQNSIDAGSLIFDDQYQWGSYNAGNPSAESIPNLKASAPDAGFGLLWYYKNANKKVNAFAGISGYHLNQPNLAYHSGVEVLPSRFSVQAGLKIKGDEKLDLNPTVIYTTQGPYKQLMIGLTADYNIGTKSKLIVGSWYKANDAIVLLAGYDHELFSLNYSYDFGNSLVSRDIYGLMTHEITIAYKMRSKF
ncbi:MAG: PorP/SprF family type IX secretion system membrane protein [Bacteroidales bacterium]|nr:PorP/SprF family type IX secretion system membrane protein [Bacteroidales bacterium]